MKILSIKKEDKTINGVIHLDGSKSISNRIQIIRALCDKSFEIENLSTSNDSKAMAKILFSDGDLFDAGAAGTTFRFATAFLSVQSGTQILTGSERMKQRPIGALVDGLRVLGAQIEYIEKEGYPPLKIGSPNHAATHKLSIPANVSSQFITAILMIAPSLPNGIELTLEGKIVSIPYIKMTLALMADFGIQHTWAGNIISITPQKYKAKSYFVESDWSAASYYYSIMAFAKKGSVLKLVGLEENSTQGDSVIHKMGTEFGIESIFNEAEKSVTLKKLSDQLPALFEYDFIKCPDIAQTLAVICAGLGIQALFTGLETLKIKETQRINAVKTELKKVGSNLVLMPKKFSKKNQEFYLIDDKVKFSNTPQFSTYEDHRMAMAFAPLAIYHEVKIEEPNVVAKSYPSFWKDFESLGFIIND